MNPLLAEAWARALDDLPLVAILRGITPEEVDAVGDALWNANWRIFEVPLNSPQPLQSIARLAQRFPGAVVGAGTVRTEDEVQQVHAAGGRLVVSPHFDARVVRAAAWSGLACVRGVMTATEAFGALEAGAHALKLFPAEMIPPAAVKALRAVLPAQVPLLPVGGIAPATMARYLAAGANGFGIGSALYRPGTSAEEVARMARAFADAWAGTLRA
jgi:2-dehydro-3-deoxyphosphogalactonate aldolase